MPDRYLPASDFLAADFDQLRSCGFSASKIATIQGIAQATLDGVVPDYATALAMDNEVLIERLASLRGVGRWTVEMLLIYSLERPDILPADDFGVRKGIARLKGLEVQPTRKQMIEIGLGAGGQSIDRVIVLREQARLYGRT